jgi:hypothetical protein
MVITPYEDEVKNNIIDTNFNKEMKHALKLYKQGKLHLFKKCIQKIFTKTINVISDNKKI